MHLTVRYYGCVFSCDFCSTFGCFLLACCLGVFGCSSAAKNDLRSKKGRSCKRGRPMQVGQLCAYDAIKRSAIQILFIILPLWICIKHTYKQFKFTIFWCKINQIRIHRAIEDSTDRAYYYPHPRSVLLIHYHPGTLPQSQSQYTAESICRDASNPTGSQDT